MDHQLRDRGRPGEGSVVTNDKIKAIVEKESIVIHPLFCLFYFTRCFANALSAAIDCAL